MKLIVIFPNPARVRLLLGKGHSCYRPRRTGERKRKSVRGCIVDQNLSALALIIVRKGEQEIPGLTDVNVPRRLGPKRASHIRKLFNLSKEDDVRKYIIKRPLTLKEAKKQRFQAPKIQRLVTPVVLQRKRHRLAIKKRRVESRKEAEAEYAKLLAQRRRDEKIRRRTRSASIRESKSSISSDKDVKKEVKKPVAKPEPAKAKAKVAAPATKKPAAKTDAKKDSTKKVDAKKPAQPAKVEAKKTVETKKVDSKKPAAAPAKKVEAKSAPVPEKKAEVKKAPEPAKKSAPKPASKPSGDAKKPKKK